MTRARSIAVKIAAFAALAVAGSVAALLLAAPAAAWDPGNLPPGWSVETIHTIGVSSCAYADRIWTANHATFSNPICTDSATFQADFDAWVNAHYTPATTSTTTTTSSSTTASTTTASTTTTSATTTDQASTTTDVSTTTTTASTTPDSPATPSSPGTVTPTSQPPEASFTETPTGLEVAFTDTSTAAAPAAIATVSWLFGDGANSTTSGGGTATHTYTAAGTFTVIEFVTDTNGLTDRSSVDITVSPFGGVAAFKETTNAKLGSAGTAVFGFRVAVYCVNSWGGVKAERGLGLSIVGSHQANVDAGVCRAITKKNATGIQLLALNHEIGHALGIRPERSADCYAWKLIPKTERELGIRDTGQRAAAWKYIVRRYGGCRKR